MYADPDTAQALTDTLSLADTAWGPMTSLMGTPVPDAGGPQGGGSPAIDIYVVDPLDAGLHNGRSYEISGAELGMAVSSGPHTGVTSSGYILVARNKLHATGFRNAFVQAFFHVLQMAHNSAIQFSSAGEYWFVEASAVWAAAHFDRTITNWPSRWAGRHADSDVFPWFDQFQDWAYRLSLHTSGPAPEYHENAAFIWPFFMEQETGSPDAIASAWDAIGSAATWSQADNAISAQLPFADNFHRFAVRNLNRTFDLQNPIGTRYSDLDSLFPDEKPPAPLPGDDSVHDVQIDASTAQRAMSIPALSARYETFYSGGHVGHWEFDFSQLVDNDNLDVDAVVLKNDGTWELRSLAITGLITICDASKVYLVLSNHSTDISSPISGSFTYRALSTPCAGPCPHFPDVISWNGTVTYDYSHVFTTTEFPGFTEQVTINQKRHR